MIEIGAVCIENGEIKDHFQSLMNPDQYIDSFIERYTGITNEMLADAPSCEEVMHKFADFIGDYNLVAHNASFDKRFLDAELARISRTYSGKFACSMLVARRLYQDAPAKCQPTCRIFMISNLLCKFMGALPPNPQGILQR